MSSQPTNDSNSLWIWLRHGPNTPVTAERVLGLKGTNVTYQIGTATNVLLSELDLALSSTSFQRCMTDLVKINVWIKNTSTRLNIDFDCIGIRHPITGEVLHYQHAQHLRQVLDTIITDLRGQDGFIDRLYFVVWLRALNSLMVFNEQTLRRLKQEAKAAQRAGKPRDIADGDDPVAPDGSPLGKDEMSVELANSNVSIITNGTVVLGSGDLLGHLTGPGRERVQSCRATRRLHYRQFSWRSMMNHFGRCSRELRYVLDPSQDIIMMSVLQSSGNSDIQPEPRRVDSEETYWKVLRELDNDITEHPDTFAFQISIEVTKTARPPVEEVPVPSPGKK